MSDEYDGEPEDAPEPRKIFWKGRQWCVTANGIETIDRDYYDIEAERLGDLTQGRERDQRPGAERLRHVGTKTWVDIEDLAAAFAIGLQVHAGRFTPLPAGAFHNTLADLRWSKTRSAVYRELKAAAGDRDDGSFGDTPLRESEEEMRRRYPDRDAFYEAVKLPRPDDL